MALNKIIISLFVLLVTGSTTFASEKPKWSSQTIYMMMTQCYQIMNQSFIVNFGVPVIPQLGLNQCACVNDKIHMKFDTENIYAMTPPDQITKTINGFSEECILEGAMGEEARKALFDALQNPDQQNLTWDNIK